MIIARSFAVVLTALVSSPHGDAAAAAYKAIDLGDLGAIPWVGSDSRKQAIGINEAGQILGTGAGPGGREPFVWDPITGVTVLAPPPHGSLALNRTIASAINDHGQVLGSWTVGNIWSANPSFRRKVVWDLAVDPVHTADPAAAGPSALRTITGRYTTDVGAPTFTPDMSSVGPLAGVPDGAMTIGYNNAGQAIGNVATRPRDSLSILNSTAFFWDPVSGMQPLLTEPGEWRSTSALALNDAGQVVGSGWIQSTNRRLQFRAFLWDRTSGLQDLNDLVEPIDRMTLTSAVGINNAGWIAATGLYDRTIASPNGDHSRVFLLIPLDDSPAASLKSAPPPLPMVSVPPTFALILSGLGAFGLIGRLRGLRPRRLKPWLRDAVAVGQPSGV